MRAMIARILEKLHERVSPKIEAPDELLIHGTDDLYDAMHSMGYTRVLYGWGPWVRAGTQPGREPAGHRMFRCLIFVHPHGYVSTLQWPKVLAGTMTVGLGEHARTCSATEFLKLIADSELVISRNALLETVVRNKRKAA